ncbi:hypothetical protein OSJ77_04065 [Phyllobacterium sp. 0TCS1.6C]|uniref:hypothetical protein n=1 Tax=unclassified Phyllobacterium TaxID=2638441 RepID=UPI0022651F48|nr:MULTISPECIES: hypothetical protein [unclassified Phyllobacterium]MCX8279352.1 hypothetical protein [Phyllobacterium sp. 0TCS1.6C]MCX8292457.1 hypothetical protein [Phyllobacterium sp. 0TCS1.6A]
MGLPNNILCRIAPLAILVPLAACSTTSDMGSRPVIIPTFAPPRPPVDAALADPCISAASAKYFLAERHIKVIDSEAVGGGVNHVRLKADIRDALCTVTDKGKVRSVVDTMPKSADQVAAEEAAARKAASGQAEAPAPVKKARKKS